jgi:DNA-binding NarL/FixJ family response regulator
MAALPILVISEDLLLQREFTVALTKDRSLTAYKATTFNGAISSIRASRFACILIDKRFGDGDGLSLAPIIRRLNSECMVVLISERTGWATTEAANNLGFSLTFEKGQPLDELIATIKRNLERRNLPLSQQDREGAKKIHRLSDREREILLDIATGKRNIEIAAYRHISESTIKSHLSSIYRKLEVRNRVEAIALLNN